MLIFEAKLGKKQLLSLNNCKNTVFFVMLNVWIYMLKEILMQYKIEITATECVIHENWIFKLALPTTNPD